jgi:hypothetical protein
MDRHFEATMGRMMKNLRDVTPVGTELENLLHDALRRRNWLIHDFFRERATEFMSSSGCEQMLHEVDECRDLFQTADERLETVVAPSQEGGDHRRVATTGYRLLSMEREHDG